MFNVSEKSSFIAWIFLQRGGCHTMCKAWENCEFAKFCVLLECYGTSENNLLWNAKVYYLWTSEASSQLLKELLSAFCISSACLYVEHCIKHKNSCTAPLVYVIQFNGQRAAKQLFHTVRPKAFIVVVNYFTSKMLRAVYSVI